MNLQESLFAGSLGFCSQSGRVIRLLVTSGIVLRLSLLTCLFNFGSFIHEPLSFLLFTGHVGLTLELNLLLQLAFVELESFSQLGDRHFLHQAVTTSFSRVESFRSLDRNLLKLSDLPNQLLLFGEFSSLLVLSLLESFLQVLVHLISDGLVLLLLKLDLLRRSFFIGVHLGNDILLLGHELLQVHLSLLHHVVHVKAHLVHQVLIFLFLALSGKNGLLSRHFHLNLFLLDVLQSLDLISLVHFSLPPIELTRIFEAHRHLVQTSLSLSILFVDQVFLAFECRHVQLDIRLVLVEVGHGSWSVALELELAHDLLFNFSLDFLGLLDRGSCLSSQSESLLVITLVLSLDSIDGRLSTLLLVVLNILEGLFVQILGDWSRLNLSFDLLRSWDHLWFGLSQIEWLELCTLGLLLLLCTF